MTKHDQARIKVTVAWIEEHTHKHRLIKLNKGRTRAFISRLCDGDHPVDRGLVTVGMLHDTDVLAGGL